MPDRFALDWKRIYSQERAFLDTAAGALFARFRSLHTMAAQTSSNPASSPQRITTDRALSKAAEDMLLEEIRRLQACEVELIEVKSRLAGRPFVLNTQPQESV